MAFTTAVTAIRTTGKWAGKETFGPNLVVKTGTWVATGVTKGTLDLTTYMSEVLGGQFYCHTGTGITLQAINRDDAAAAVAGKAAIQACTANDAGDWYFWGIEA